MLFRSAVRVAEWERLGLVNPWFIDKGHICYRGVHGMKEIPRYLAEGLDIRTSARVARITSGRSVVLETGEEFHADAVLITAPAPQAMALLEAPPAAIANAFTKIEFDPCFAVLASLEGTSQISLPGYVRPDAGPIEWLADNAAKGISSSAGAITIHATAAFTRRHLNAPHEDIGQMLLGAAEPYLGSPVIDYQVHRWLYSKPVPADLPVAVVDNGFAIAGDAFGGGRVEGAFLSGLTVAELIARS